MVLILAAVPILAAVGWLTGYADARSLAADALAEPGVDPVQSAAFFLGRYQLPASVTATLTNGPWLNFAVLYLAAMTTGNEYAWGTIRNVLLASPSRTQYVLARFTFLAGVAILLTVVVALVGAVLPLAAATVTGIPATSSGASANVPYEIGSLVAGTLLYGAVGVLLATILRNAAVPLVITAVYVVGETLVSPLQFWQGSDVLRWLPRLLPGNSVAGVVIGAQRDAGLVGQGAQLPDYLATPWDVSLVATVVWIVLMLVGSMAALRAADITE
jgi:ABC-type transport system involved in multi-copper enzyme maturation permease subunit